MSSLLRELLLLCALVALGVSYSCWSGRTTSPWIRPELAAGEIRLADALVLDAVWVDARPKVAYTTAHLPSAHSLNSENWDQQLPQIIAIWLEQPRPVIVYCQSAKCNTSHKIADRLRENLPDAEIYVLPAGWSTKEGGLD
jgi:rhodanese-related sulfurtransferase